MIGIIVTGHGEFATGLKKNIKMLSGVDIDAVDFLDNVTPEQLDEKLIVALEKYNNLKNIIIFTDIPGGTPYNRSVTVSLSKPNVRVVAGTNVPMLLSAAIKNLSNEEYENIDELIDTFLSEGKAGMMKFVMPDSSGDEQNSEDDGI